MKKLLLLSFLLPTALYAMEKKQPLTENDRRLARVEQIKKNVTDKNAIVLFELYENNTKIAQQKVKDMRGALESLKSMEVLFDLDKKSNEDIENFFNTLGWCVTKISLRSKDEEQEINFKNIVSDLYAKNNYTHRIEVVGAAEASFCLSKKK